MKKILLLIISIISLFIFAGCQKGLDSDDIDLLTINVSPLSMTLTQGQTKEIKVTAKTNSGVKTDITSACNFSILEMDISKDVIKLKGNKVTGLLPGLAKIKVEYKNLPIGYPTVIVK